MKLTCPDCGAALAVENMNVQADTAICDACDSVHSITALLNVRRAAAVGEVRPKSVVPLDDFPPKGSKLEIYETGSNGDIEIYMPAKGFSGMSLFLGGFSTFWLAFVAFWTWGASHAGPFALFSIPFWIVGVGLMTSTIRGITERQSLRFGENTLTLLRHRLFRTKSETIPVDEIDALLDGGLAATNPFKTAFMLGHANSLSATNTSNNQTMDVPNLQVGVKSYSFFEGVEGVEKDWLMHIVRKLLNERRSSPL